MNIIEKLELFQQQLIGVGQTAAACDLQNIIEEYKKQEPFGYFKAEPFGWTDCSEFDEGAVALYENPPLSNENSKNDELDKLKKIKDMYLELIMSVARKFPNETRHETALRYILRAEKGSNNPTKEMKADK